MWKQEKHHGNSTTLQEADDMHPSSLPSRVETGEDVSAFVGKGVDFKGTITYKGTVRIDGSLEGEIHTDGVLLVGEEAVIKAKVKAGTVVCKGKITGDVHATEKIKLRAPAVVTGGVKTPLLSIDEGVLFNGTLEMAQGPREMKREPAIRAVNAAEQIAAGRING